MDTLWLFTLLAFGIMLVPGMDMAFVLSSALAHGRAAGFAAVAGMVAGGAAHVVLGTLGVGLLLQVFPAGFHALLVGGAAYVAWIGWSLWRARISLAEPGAAPGRLDRTFLRALATCLLNPKAYLFMVAVFPQFMRPEHGSLGVQAAVLGAIIVAAQAVVYGGVAAGASGLRATLGRNVRAQERITQGVGLLLMGTAAWTVVQAWGG